MNTFSFFVFLLKAINAVEVLILMWSLGILLLGLSFNFILALKA